MKKYALRFLLPFVIALVAGGSVVNAAEPAIISKARSYLGTEAALNQVETLHFYGELSIEGQEDAGPISVEIIFQKPYKQLSVIKSDRGTEITGLDGYDGWQRVTAKGDESRWRLSLMGIPQVKNLRANAWENLAFFRGLEAEGGRLEDQGIVEIDGVSTRKVAFIHSPQIVFTRYFDLKTGRLVLTETMRGEKIREEGSMVVDGVRFPKTLNTLTPAGDGETRKVTITFSRVVVNENLPADTFAIPPLTSN